MTELERYAAVAWAPDDLIELRPLQPWQGTRAWTLAKDLPKHFERMQAENDRGANMFAGILPRTRDGGGTAEDVDGGRVIWADFDNCDPAKAIESVGAIGLPVASMVVNSGHGTHLFWKLDGFITKAELAATVSGLISYMLSQPETQKYVDKSAKDPARILRLPGFINNKPPAAMSNIVYDEPDKTYNIADFAKFMQKAPAKPIQRSAIQHTKPAGGRGAAYIDKIEGSSEGGRTGQLYKAACALINDMSLTDDESLPLLISWDSYKNTPPVLTDPKYGETEFHKIIANVHKYAKKQPGCLNIPQSPEKHIINGVNLSGLMSRTPKEVIRQIPEKFLNPPGFMGALIEFNNETAIKPQPVLALAGAIALQAVLCARKVTDKRGTRPNIYLCGVAESGAGKDYSRQLNKRILLEAGISELQAEGIKSGSGLINALVIQPAILFQIDEYGRYIKTANNQRQSPHIYEVVSKLLSLYSSSGGAYESDRYADSDKGGKLIKDPQAVLYGTTVPRSLYEGLSEESITDGFLPRTLIFDVEGEDPKRRIREVMQIPAEIIETAKWWSNFNPGGGNMNPESHITPITAEAEDIALSFINHEHKEKKAMNGAPLSTMWTRTAQNADKLALIYAVSRSADSPIIDGDAARWAYGLAEWLTRRMISVIGDNVADNPFHRETLKCKRLIKRAGGRMARGQLVKQMRIKARELDDVINNMIQAGELIDNLIGEGTSARVEYVIIEGGK